MVSRIARVLGLIAAAVAFDAVGGVVARVSGLPVFLDTIGTVTVAVLAGPAVGALAGLAHGAVFVVAFASLAAWFAPATAAVGAAAGYLAQHRWFATLPRAAGAGIVLGVVAAVVSTPIDVAVLDGRVGVYLADILYASLVDQGYNHWLATAAGETLVQVPDKLLTALIAAVVLRAAPAALPEPGHR